MNNEKRMNGYYDIELDLGKIIENDVSGYFYVQNLKQRKLYLDCDVDQMSVEDIVTNILQYNREDKGIPVDERQPILLYLSSNGGEVDSGFELIDAILASKTPVYTINLAYCYSMAFLIALAGHKRYAMRNAKFLMHDGSSFVYNSGNKVKDQMKFQEKVEERIKQYVLNHSKISENEYDSKLRVEWYLFADDAKEKGFVDCIVGEDCELEEVI